jgi:hypothetical protein
MKKVLVSIVLGAALCLLVFGSAGCGYIGRADDIVEQKAVDVIRMGPDREETEQMGETVAEGHRRHIRNHRLNRQAMMEDIDAFFHLDQPCRTTERTIP